MIIYHLVVDEIFLQLRTKILNKLLTGQDNFENAEDNNVKKRTRHYWPKGTK